MIEVHFILNELYCLEAVQAMPVTTDVAVQVPDLVKSSDQQSHYELTSEDCKYLDYIFLCLNHCTQCMYTLYCDIVIHAYHVILRASMEKEQQLQSQLAIVQQDSMQKDIQLSKLKDDMSKKMLVNKDEYEQEQEVLKGLQMKG